MAIIQSGTSITFNDATTQTSAANVFYTSGTAMLFQQTAAPTGWTKVTTYNNYAIRIVSGSVSTGGTVAFTTAFASQAVSGTNTSGAVTATTLTTAQIPSHTHDYANANSPSSTGCGSSGPYNVYNTTATGATGGGTSHTHAFTQPTFTGTAINLAVQYVDHIIATKN
jgi:hypothetical protein